MTLTTGLGLGRKRTVASQFEWSAASRTNQVVEAKAQQKGASSWLGIGSGQKDSVDVCLDVKHDAPCFL
jgi:hypothetical protein